MFKRRAFFEWDCVMENYLKETDSAFVMVNSSDGMDGPPNLFATLNEVINITLLRKTIILHEKVRSQLKEGQKLFLLPKSWKYFHDLLNGKTGILLGIMSDEKLVGMTAVVRADGFFSAINKGALTCPYKHEKLPKGIESGKIAVVQSLCVLKEYGGNGYSDALLEEATNHAIEINCKHLVAQSSESNKAGVDSFISQGFAITANWVSRCDKVHRVLLYKDLSAQMPTAKPSVQKVAVLHY